MKNSDEASAGGTESNTKSDMGYSEMEKTVSFGKVKMNAIDLSSLQELKAVFLSMDWEINDQTLNKLISESEKLMESAKGDLVLVAFFKMLSAIGKYIKNHKANAHKGAVGLLGSVFGSMEKVIGTEKMPYRDRERLVVDQITKFQVLKQKISGAKISPAIKKRMDKVTMKDQIKAIQEEMTTLRKEVAELREQVKKAIKV